MIYAEWTIAICSVISVIISIWALKRSSKALNQVNHIATFVHQNIGAVQLDRVNFKDCDRGIHIETIKK